MLRAAETIQLTDTGRQRRDNEDSMFARAPLFVVADGMGGAQAGEVASRIAVEAFEQGLPDQGSAEERLTVRVHEANARIYEISRAEHERAGMGTTLTAAYIDDSRLAIAHVGDSRAYLFRDDTLQRLTQDHSLVGELVRRGKLTEAQAEEHPQRSIITRALGPEEFVEVDTWSYALRHNDVLLLCSDGLTSMINEAKITEVLQAAPTLRDAAERLIGEANAAGGRDNITVVLSRIEEIGEADDAGVDAPTMVGVSSAGETSTRTIAPPSPAAAPEREAPATGERAGSRAATMPNAKVPLARKQGPPAPPPVARRERRFAKPAAALIATLIVLGLVGGGGYLASRQLYFIGTDSQGIVTIYRGFPYDLPAGVHLYETFYTSGVPAAQVPVDRRKTLFNDHLRAQSDAESLVRALELGQLSK
jgi:serine/threonine protein phosphatase PrpC